MKKVLILLKHLSLGGAEKMFTRIFSDSNIGDYEVDIKLVFNTQLQDIILPTNFKISSIFEEKNEHTKSLIINHSQVVYEQNIKKDYDVEIAFLEGYPTKIIGSSVNPSSIKIAFIHTDFQSFHHSLNAFKNSDEEVLYYQRFTNLIFVSKSAQLGFNKTYPSLSKKNEIIYYPPLKESTLTYSYQYPNIEIEKPYFITLTRLSPEKGLFKLIDAVKKLKEYNFNVCFKIFGMGPLYNSLQRKIKEDNLENDIFLLNYHPSPYNELRNSLAYICPSDSESFCLAIEESLFLNIPIIACKCAGTTEILSNGKYGLLVDNNSNGVFKGILDFLSSSTLREDLSYKSQNGKKYWESVSNSETNFFKICLPDTNI